MHRLSCLVLVGLAALCLAVSDKGTGGIDRAVMQKFIDFKNNFAKVYADQAEFAYRLKVFQENLNTIDELNARQGPGSRVFGINKFADLSPAEFKEMYLNRKKNPVSSPNHEVEIHIPNVPLPSSFDWRDKGAVTPVYNQEQCGSCWAFSATEAIESQWFLAGNQLAKLSMQQIVDCDQGRGDEGCDGGDTPTAYEYVIAAGGLDSLSSYPYTGEDGNCAFQQSSIVAKISGWGYVTKTKNETEMQLGLVSKGPLSICVDAASWQFYLGGVVSNFCGNDLDHCVMITGYQDDYKTWDGVIKKIWLIRNSWGADWGESGYIYVERGSDLCGVADEVTLPVV